MRRGNLLQVQGGKEQGGKAVGEGREGRVHGMQVLQGASRAVAPRAR